MKNSLQELVRRTGGRGTGDGVDHIADSSIGGQTNTLRFGDGININNIVLGLGSLKLDLSNGDIIHIDNFNRNDAANSSGIQNFEFADGSSYSASGQMRFADGLFRREKREAANDAQLRRTA